MLPLNCFLNLRKDMRIKLLLKNDTTALQKNANKVTFLNVGDMLYLKCINSGDTVPSWLSSIVVLYCDVLSVVLVSQELDVKMSLYSITPVPTVT